MRMADEMGQNRTLAYDREFDERYRYDGKDLGAVCKDGRTVFKVWSPLAESVELRLYRSGVSRAWLRKELKACDRGVWALEFPESLHGMYYDYLVRINGKERRTADPYATGCSCNGGRSMVVDLRQTDPEGFGEDASPEEGGERIIYELHIKDFSYDADSGVPEEYRGKYKAFTVPQGGVAEEHLGEYKAFTVPQGAGREDYPMDSQHSADCAQSMDSLHPVGMEYLKRLGVTHVHLLPFFDYGSVDEAGGEDQFNWGYDPVNYNVPEGSFATDTGDGVVRIRECKEMIRALHRAGLRVVMDVVYNHTHEADSWLERTMPGYFTRRYEDGTLSDGSACGSDMAVGRAMVDNYIVESILYWAREYHLDGFRFDLMGLLTTELMNRIREELDAEFGPGEKLLYGEPWRANESPMEAGTHAALKANIARLHENIAVFSDDTRDVIKGDVFLPEVPGFVNGGKGLEKHVLEAVAGWRSNEEGFQPKSCSQVVNYISAHDNFTLWDKLLCTVGKALWEKSETKARPEGWKEKFYEEPIRELLDANKLAALICFTCQGHLFFQAGEEFGRTKFGDENSFRSAPEVNMLDWKRSLRFGELLDYYKGLIALRKKLPGLCDKSSRAAERITGRTVRREGVVSFFVDNGGEGRAEWDKLLIVYNASDTPEPLELPEGQWEVLADKSDADCRKRAEGKIQAAAQSGLILGRAGRQELK